MADWSAKNPFMTTVSQQFDLYGEGSKKETRLIELEIKNTGLEYKAGDA